MTFIDQVSAVLRPFGYVAEPADSSLYDVLGNDLAESDVFDLQNTWRNDWRAELLATLTNGEAVIAVRSPLHDGVAVFGASKGPGLSAQMWLLQSVSFTQGAERVHGNNWATRAVQMSRQVVSLFQKEFGTVFNFKDKRQVRSIKWLQMCGFRFFEWQTTSCDLLFFGLGPQTPAMAGAPRFWKNYLGDKIALHDVDGVSEITRN